MFLSYVWYVLRHKWYVFVECCKLGIPWRGLVHDLSKFLPIEFKAYAKYFYGVPKFSNADEFNAAWEQHIKRNKHHWNYWVYKIRVDSSVTADNSYAQYWTFGKKMPEVYIKEMVADWVGAGKAIKGYNDIKGWYEENKNNMSLNYYTRKRVEELLERY